MKNINTGPFGSDDQDVLELSKMSPRILATFKFTLTDKIKKLRVLRSKITREIRKRKMSRK